MVSAWRPKDEAEAASAMAGFVEWLRASGRFPAAEPAAVLDWAAGRTAAFDAALAAFMGWPNAAPRLPRDTGEALVWHRNGRRDAWGHDALPAWAHACLAADPVGLAAFHLLRANTRPDDRLLWMGDPGDALPLGALLVGATVILADCPTPDLAAAERAGMLSV